MSVRRLANNRYRVQIRRKGFPRYDRVFASEAEARAAYESVLASMRDPQQAAEDMTLAEAWRHYAASADFADKSPRTRDTERGRIKPVLERLGGYALARLAERPRLIWEYIDARSRDVSPRTGRKLSKTSIRLELAALSSVAEWAVRRQLLLRNFVHDVKRPGQSKRKRRVARFELGSLDNATLLHDEPKLAESARFALLCWWLGCRPGELAALRRDDVRFANSEITFRDTKNKTDRVVHLVRQALSLLNSQLRYAIDAARMSPYVFSTRGRDGGWKPYNYSQAAKRLRNAGIVASDFHLHAMRREFISRAIEAGIPYATIRKQTGHKSTQAIEIYDEGLSTAPEIRAVLDKHAAAVNTEKVEGLLEVFAHNIGLPQAHLDEMLRVLRGEKASVVRRVMANGEEVPLRIKKRRE